MSTPDFKLYIIGDREYFVSGKKKADFPFPESLLQLMYLDVWSLEPLTRKIDQALLSLYQSREERYAQEVLAGLETLAQEHIYFSFLRDDWQSRLEEAEQRGYEDILDLLPHKEIAHIPSDLDAIQKQLRALFEAVLDGDGRKAPIPQKLVQHNRYCREQGNELQKTFSFQPLSVNYELTEQGAFADVLYPKSMYDMIDYELRECLRREQRMRVCKNCGRFFALTGRGTAEYCDWHRDEKGRTCREIGAINQWTKSRSGDEVFKEYRREYKKRFAWIKAGKIPQTVLYEWGERAREKKAECERGEITLEEFKAWLRES